MEDLEEFLNEVAEYVSNLRQIVLLSIRETDRTVLYNDVKRFFYEKEKDIRVRLVHDLGSDHKKDRLSVYYFLDRFASVDISELADVPAITITGCDEAFLKNMAHQLTHSIKERLGYELSVEEK